MDLALFSGGKDSTLALLRAEELVKQSIPGLLFTVPSFPFPSPHYENMDCVHKIARLMGKRLGVVTLPRGAEQRVLSDHLRKWGARTIVAGDVLLDDHLLWHEEVALRAGASLMEPLYNADTHGLFWETVERGIEFLIIACRPPCPPELLGKKVDQRNAGEVYDKLVKANVDPIGELGEYHTLVTRTPFSHRQLNPRIRGYRDRGAYGRYVLLDCGV